MRARIPVGGVLGRRREEPLRPDRERAPLVEFPQLPLQVLAREIDLEVPVRADRDAPRLLRDHDHDRVGLLAHAQRGAVARAHRLRELVVVRQREEAGGRGDPLVLDDDRAVVQGRALEEDRLDQVARDGRVDARAALDVLAEAHVALDRDQGARAVGREARGGRDELADDLDRRAAEDDGEEARPGEPEEEPPELRREDDERRERDASAEVLEDGFDALESEDAGHRRGAEEREDDEEDEALEDAVAARAADRVEDEEIDQGQDDDLDDGVNFELHATSPGSSPVYFIRSAILAASAISRTSWTRTMSAPRRTAAATVAEVPSRRSSTPRPKTRPMKLLRDVPTTTGRPSDRNSSSRLRISRLCSGRLP